MKRLKNSQAFQKSVVLTEDIFPDSKVRFSSSSLNVIVNSSVVVGWLAERYDFKHLELRFEDIFFDPNDRRYSLDKILNKKSEIINKVSLLDSKILLNERTSWYANSGTAIYVIRLFIKMIKTSLR